MILIFQNFPMTRYLTNDLHGMIYFHRHGLLEPHEYNRHNKTPLTYFFFMSASPLVIVKWKFVTVIWRSQEGKLMGGARIGRCGTIWG